MNFTWILSIFFVWSITDIPENSISINSKRLLIDEALSWVLYGLALSIALRTFLQIVIWHERFAQKLAGFFGRHHFATQEPHYSGLWTWLSVFVFFPFTTFLSLYKAYNFIAPRIFEDILLLFIFCVITIAIPAISLLMSIISLSRYSRNLKSKENNLYQIEDIEVVGNEQIVAA